MSLRLIAAACLCGVLSAGTIRAQSQLPEPKPYPTEWQLDFTAQQPRLIAVPDLSGQLRWYAYIVYEVVNRTDAERVFIPEIIIATDQGDLIRAGDNVPLSVFNAVKEQEVNALLESTLSITGPLLRGEDNARLGVMIWPVFDHDIGELSVFIGGLSGEAYRVPSPIDGEPMVMVRTLVLTYDQPGNPPREQDRVLTNGRTSWVVR